MQKVQFPELNQGIMVLRCASTPKKPHHSPCNHATDKPHQAKLQQGKPQILARLYTV